MSTPLDVDTPRAHLGEDDGEHHRAAVFHDQVPSGRRVCHLLRGGREGHRLGRPREQVRHVKAVAEGSRASVSLISSHFRPRYSEISDEIFRSSSHFSGAHGPVHLASRPLAALFPLAPACCQPPSSLAAGARLWWPLRPESRGAAPEPWPGAGADERRGGAGRHRQGPEARAGGHASATPARFRGPFWTC